MSYAVTVAAKGFGPRGRFLDEGIETNDVEDCKVRVHAFGRDDKGLLIWQTEASNSIDEVVKTLAQTKIAFRTGLPFAQNRANAVDRRHILAYPITHHATGAWGNSGRLANQLRFKVARRDGQFVGLVYHLPARLPAQLRKVLDTASQKFVDENELPTWQSVHAELDRKLSGLVVSAQQPHS